MATGHPTAFTFAREIMRISGWRLFPKRREQAGVRTPVGERDTAQLESTSRCSVRVPSPGRNAPFTLLKDKVELCQENHQSLQIRSRKRARAGVGWGGDKADKDKYYRVSQLDWVFVNTDARTSASAALLPFPGLHDLRRAAFFYCLQQKRRRWSDKSFPNESRRINLAYLSDLQSCRASQLPLAERFWCLDKNRSR